MYRPLIIDLTPADDANRRLSRGDGVRLALQEHTHLEFTDAHGGSILTATAPQDCSYIGTEGM